MSYFKDPEQIFERILIKGLWDLDALKTQIPGFLKGFVASLKDFGTYIPLHIASLKDSNEGLH